MPTNTMFPYVYQTSGTGGGGGTSVHNDLTGIQGGAASEYYHLTDAQNTAATREATASQSGLATAAQITKLDSLESFSANDIYSSVYENATGLTPTDTNTIPYAGSGVTEGAGVRVTYDDGGGNDFYYGIVSSVTASTSFDTFLPIFNASYAVTKIEACAPSALIQIGTLNAPGKYAGEAHDDLLADWDIPELATVGFALGRARIKHAADDSAATTSGPTVNINFGGNNIFSAEKELTTSWSDFTGAMSLTNYLADAADAVDIKVTKATGGTPGDNADSLSVFLIGVPL